MNENRSITIHSEVDVVTARMVVRELARGLGMNLGDQARISLATSSLAHALGLGGTYRGKIEVSSVRNDTRAGVQVICTRSGAPRSLEPGALGETRWMVDELTVEEQPPDDLKVSLIKWVAS